MKERIKKAKRRYFIGNGHKLVNPEYITDLPTDQKIKLAGTTGYCAIVWDYTKARFYEDIKKVFRLYNKQPEWFKNKYSVYYAKYNSFGHLVYVKARNGSKGEGVK